MNGKISYIALVLALIAVGFSVFGPRVGNEQSSKKETAFERVTKTQTIRCAYALWPPFFMQDPNTKEKSGINYEIVEAIGKVAKLKIDWVEEVGYGSYPENLRSGKEDVFCSGSWMSLPRAQRVEYTSPLEYSALYAYVREDDARFDGNLNAINNEQVTIAVTDGSTLKAVADTGFPKAKQYALPENTDDSQALLAVSLGKADVVFLDEFAVGSFNEHATGKKLKRISGVAPARLFGAGMAVAKGEWELRDLLNLALAELRLRGTIDEIINKYEKIPGSVMRVPAPISLSGKQ